MKKIAVLLTLLVFSTTAISATNTLDGGTISGRVIDSKLKQALPYVNIILKSKSGTIIPVGLPMKKAILKLIILKKMPLSFLFNTLVIRR